jgi:hypothetical protein
MKSSQIIGHMMAELVSNIHSIMHGREESILGGKTRKKETTMIT